MELQNTRPPWAAYPDNNYIIIGRDNREPVLSFGMDMAIFLTRDHYLNNFPYGAATKAVITRLNV